MSGSLILPMPMFFFVCQVNHSIFEAAVGPEKKEVSRSKVDMSWIFTMNNLFNKMFGKDALSYEFDKGLK